MQTIRWLELDCVKGKKEFYNGIVIEDEESGVELEVHINDFVYVSSGSKYPFLAQVKTLFVDKTTGDQCVSLKWFYRRSDVVAQLKAVKNPNIPATLPNEVFSSSSSDVNSVSVMIGKFDLYTDVAAMPPQEENAFLCRYHFSPGGKQKFKAVKPQQLNLGDKGGKEPVSAETSTSSSKRRRVSSGTPRAGDKAQVGGPSSTLSHAASAMEEDDPATMKDATRFLTQLKSYFQSEPEMYHDFTVVLRRYGEEEAEVEDVIKAAVRIFGHVSTLMKGFHDFVPHEYHALLKTEDAT